MAARVLAILILSVAVGCGTGDGTATQALDMGGAEANQISALVEELNDANTNPKRWDTLFAKGSKPTDAKKFGRCNYYVSGKPNVTGTTASCKVRVDTTKGEQLGEADWTFEKDGDKWKVKSAPLP